jgi:hypothetical protein
MNNNYNQNMNNYNQNQNMNDFNQNMDINNQNINNNYPNQNMNDFNQNMDINNQNMNNNNQNINNNQNQIINNYNNNINNSPNNYQQNMNNNNQNMNNNYINNNINMNNNNNSNMNNNNVNFNSNYIMNNNNMNQNNNIYNQNYNNNMNQNISYNISEIKSLYCFRYIKEDMLNIVFSIYQNTKIKTQIPKFITKNELYYIADSIKNKSLLEFSDPNGIVLIYNNKNIIQKDDSDIKFLKDNASIQIMDNSAPEYDYTYYKNLESNIKDKKTYTNLFFDYDCIKYNMQFPRELPFNEVSHNFFSKYAIEKSNRDKFKFNFKLGSSIIEANNATPIENLDLIDFCNLKIDAYIRDPYKKIDYPGKQIKGTLIEKYEDLMPKTEFHVGTLQQIKKLYELINNELEAKNEDNQNKDKDMPKNKYKFTIVINEKEIRPQDEIIFSSLGIRDDFSFKLINKIIFFKNH